MRKRLALSFLLSLLPGLLFAQQKLTSGRAPLAFTHVTVIDVAKGTLQPDMTIVVKGNHIAELVKSGKVTLSKDAQVVDAHGKFMIPGLWDMAAWVLEFRTYNLAVLPLYVAHGVLSVRDLGSNVPLSAARRLKDSIAAGTVIGPRLFVPIAFGGRQAAVAIPVHSPEAAQKLIDSLAAAGADYVKFYQNLPPELLPAVLDAAHRHGLQVSGNVVFGYKEAAEAGLRVIDHPADFLRSVSKNRAIYARVYRFDTRAEIDSAIAREFALTYGAAALDTVTDWRRRAYAWFAALGNDPDTAYYHATLSTLAHLGVWIVTNFSDWGQSMLRFEYLDPARARFRSLESNRALFRNMTTGRVGDFAKDFDRYSQAQRGIRGLVDRLHRAGVKLVAGTQVEFETGITPGLSIHDELVWLNEGGLSPGEALQAATLEPARLLHVADSLGTVEKGKLADLVLLDANPLEDIHNTQKINAVVVNGRFLDRKALDRLLAEVEALVKPK